MLKLLAALRTIFLLFIVGFTVRAVPLWSSVARTFDEQYARCSEALGILIRSAWIAIAWITFETAVGWWMATRRPKVAADLPKAGGEPPFAPPPHR
jgi:hypothetical protein